MPFLETASPVSLGNQSYHFPVTDTRLTYTTHTPSVLERERQRMNHVHKEQFSLGRAHSKKASHCTHTVIRQFLSPRTWLSYNVEGVKKKYKQYTKCFIKIQGDLIA